MAYSGVRNKRLVELFRRQGVNAIGLTGLDGGLVQGARNRGIRVVEGGKKMMKRDFSGKPKSINASLLNLLLEQGYVPVVTIPIVDEDGFAINSENDDIVSELAQAVRRQDGLEMPPEEELDEREIAALVRWVASGAVWPEGIVQ